MRINLYRKGDSEEVLNYKLRLWESMKPAPFIMAVSGIVVWFLKLPLYATAMWIFGGYVLILALALLILKKHERIIATIMLYCGVLFSMIVTLLFGGILASGGVVFVGLATAMFSMSFLNRNHTQILFGVYLLFILASPLIQPHITPVEVIPPRINLYLFIAHILVIAINIYAVTSHYLQESIQLKAREAEQLKLLDKMKNDFYTNISHEFRTPLTVIIGMADQILKKPEDLLTKGMNAIRKNGHRLLYLVNQMLDLAKLESGNLELHLIQDDVINFLKYILEPHFHLAEEKDIHLNIIISDNKIIMDFDPDRLESVIGNLVSNAIKHAPSSSDIDIKISKEFTTLNEGQNDFKLFDDESSDLERELLMFKIKDAGPGIKPDKIPLIFNRFYQDKTLPDGQLSGSGIGLALVRDLLTLMKGQLFVRSSPENGAEFILFIPISREADSADTLNDKIKDITNDPSLPISKISGHRHHLLIIEDNRDIAQYIASILQEEYDISYASDGLEGITKARSILPDVIISDIMMPEKDGYEVCYTLKTDQSTSHIPIILLTARADQESKIQGLESGADAYLVKPFHSTELITRLRNLWKLRESLQEKYKAMAITGIEKSLPENHDTRFMKEVKKMIEHHLDDPNFDINQLSNQLHTSRTHLYRKIKALTGHSASELLRSIRLEQAREMLLNTDLNISEIGYEVGFKDPSYFSRAFNREFGMSPSRLREQLYS